MSYKQHPLLRCMDDGALWPAVLFPIRVVLLFLLLVTVHPFRISLADGSKELNARTGYRSYLIQASEDQLTGILLSNRFYVYMEPGERMLLGSSAIGIGEGDIRVITPDGITKTCLEVFGDAREPLAGRIMNLDQEQAGPDPKSGGYIPCTFVNESPASGIWEVQFLSPHPASWKSSRPLPAQVDWRQASDVNTIAAWDVTVQGDRGMEQSGRVFAEQIPLHFGEEAPSFSALFYLLTGDGYAYEVVLHNIQTHTFILFSNRDGFQDATTRLPLYKSVPLDWSNVANKELPEGVTHETPGISMNGSGAIHKIFFSPPSPLIEGQIPFSGGLARFRRSPRLPGSATTFHFTGRSGKGGSFSFNAVSDGRYQIIIDLNNNGIWGDASDRMLHGFAQSGIHHVVWDGLDSHGRAVHTDENGYLARLVFTAGEMHLPFLDVEQNARGISITRLNGPRAPESSAYYDDSILSNVGAQTGSVKRLGGVSSRSGAHAYPEGFGNGAGIDTWSYAVSDPIELERALLRTESDLRISLSSESDAPARNEPFDVSLFVHNDGPDTSSAARVKLTLPGSFRLQSSAASTGYFDTSKSEWILERVPVGKDERLVLTLIASEGGTLPISAEVIDVLGYDPDSTPNNALDPGSSSPVEDDTDEMFFYVDAKPAIGIAQRVSQPVGAASGFETEVEILVENLGNIPLSELQLQALLPEGLQGTRYTVSEPVVRAPLRVNANFDGKADANLLDPASTLHVGERSLVTYTLHVVPEESLGPYLLSAKVQAQGPAGQYVEDLSHDGNRVDPNGNGRADEPEENDPTVLTVDQKPAIGAALEVIELQGDPTAFSAIFRLNIENLGDVFLDSIQVELNLANVLGADRFSISDVRSDRSLSLNDEYDGVQHTRLLEPVESELAAGQHATITFQITARPAVASNQYAFQARATALGPNRVSVADYSDRGRHSDSDGNRFAGDPGEGDPSIVSFDEVPAVGASLRARRVSGDLSGFTVHYELQITNIGKVTLYDIQALQDLERPFAGTRFTVYDLSSQFTVRVNDGFDGVVQKGLIDEINIPLVPGASIQVSYSVDVHPETQFGPFENSVFVTAKSFDGRETSDVTDGQGPIDENGNGIADEPGENDPHRIQFAPESGLGSALFINEVKGDFRDFVVDYTFVLENMSDVKLTSVDITQRLDTTFTGSRVRVLEVLAERPLQENPLFDGIEYAQLLAADSSSLSPGEKAAVKVKVQVTPETYFGAFYLGAAASGVTPFGTRSHDVTDSGISVDPNGNGITDEVGENDPAVLSLHEKPVIGSSMTARVLEEDDAGFLVRHVVRVGNLGDVPLGDVQVEMDLAEWYEGADVDVLRTFVRGAVVANASFDGRGQIQVLDAGNSRLERSDTARIEVYAHVKPGSNFGPYQSLARASASGPGGLRSVDLSDRGTVIDANRNGTANEEVENVPTYLNPLVNASVGSSRVVSEATRRGPGEYAVTFNLAVQNVGDVPLREVRIIEDLKSLYEGSSASVHAVSIRGESAYKINPDFDGVSDTNLILPDTVLLYPGERIEVELEERITPAEGVEFLETFSRVTAVDPHGNTVQDVSIDGFEPDPNGNGNASDEGEDVMTRIELVQQAKLGLETRMVEVSGDTTSFRVGLRAYVSNHSPVELDNVELELDLSEAFPVSSVDVKEITISGTPSLKVHPEYDGKTTTNLLHREDSRLAPGEVGTVAISFEVTPDAWNALYEVAMRATAVPSSEQEGVTSPVEILPVTIKTSSGNDAGLESNGDLAGLLAERMYRRQRRRVDHSINQTGALHLETLRASGPASMLGTGGPRADDLLHLIPEVGPDRSEAIVVTPGDLFGVTNATNVVAVDYVSRQSRLAGIFATTTPAGETYEHTKTVCDRLKGASLKGVNLVSIKGHPFVMSILVNQDGEVDYAISFINYRKGNSHLIDSRFVRDQYKPERVTTEEIINVQVWSFHPEHTIWLVERMLEQMSELGNVAFVSREGDIPKAPSSFVSTGAYHSGELNITIKRVPGGGAYRLSGELSRTEGGARDPFEFTASHGPSEGESFFVPVSINTGALYDATLFLTNEANEIVDQVYIADGGWGHILEDSEETSIEIYEILAQPDYDPSETQYVVERGVHFKGTLRDSVLFFRHFKPGGTPVDLSPYDYVTFAAAGRGKGKMRLETEDGKVFEEDLELNSTSTAYNVSFEELSKKYEGRSFNSNALTSISFVMTSPGENDRQVELRVEGITFEQGQPVSAEKPHPSIPERYFLDQNYPNPFNPLTNIRFGLPEMSAVKLELFDLLGRKVWTMADQVYPPGIHVIPLEAGHLASGVYVYRMKTKDQVFTKTLQLLK